jgi:hypothetical protein
MQRTGGAGDGFVDDEDIVADEDDFGNGTQLYAQGGSGGQAYYAR